MLHATSKHSAVPQAADTEVDSSGNLCQHVYEGRKTRLVTRAALDLDLDPSFSHSGVTAVPFHPPTSRLPGVKCLVASPSSTYEVETKRSNEPQRVNSLWVVTK